MASCQSPAPSGRNERKPKRALRGRKQRVMEIGMRRRSRQMEREKPKTNQRTRVTPKSAPEGIVKDVSLFRAQRGTEMDEGEGRKKRRGFASSPFVRNEKEPKKFVIQVRIFFFFCSPRLFRSTSPFHFFFLFPPLDHVGRFPFPPSSLNFSSSLSDQLFRNLCFFLFLKKNEGSARPHRHRRRRRRERQGRRSRGRPRRSECFVGFGAAAARQRAARHLGPGESFFPG